MKTLNELLHIVQNKKERKKIVVASAADELVLKAISEFQKFGLIEPILVGKKNEISRILDEYKIALDNYNICSAEDDVESAKISVEIVRKEKGDMLMKGLLSTKIFIKEILNKKTGINTSGYFSHVGIFESPYYHKLFGLTDAAINIAPDLATKKHIIINAVQTFHNLGIAKPKVALLAPIERINPKMQSTIDAAQLVKMQKSEKFTECEIEGPLALDIAISETAAKHKGVNSRIAGNVDILVVPEISSGNVFYKSLTYLGNAKAAGVLIGAAAPVVLTSRTDSPESKLYSLAFAYNQCNRK
ncbi:MAG: bifunctional enoyl-CoA hydratase/phosphate acetyltransferase [Bacteroidales bacterium]|nr:bifunctional enoyl-CoA hydratase/phosphate acetyltransferase [Bacteroidales bacterium]